MNNKTIQFIASLAVIGMLGACTASKTPDPASDAAALRAAKPADSPASNAPAAAEEEAAPTAVPATADGVWQAIDQQSADLKTTIQSGVLKEVHHKAFAIRDLVAALPAHASMLPAESQAKLQGEVKFVSTLADRLDAAGDANDKAGAQDNYDKLVAVLNGITRTKSLSVNNMVICSSIAAVPLDGRTRWPGADSNRGRFPMRFGSALNH